MTPEKQRLAEVASACAPLLREQGFKKRGVRWNRSVGAGIVHAIDFIMGPRGWALPVSEDASVEPGWGSFNLEFGVYVPEIDPFRESRGWIFAQACKLRTDRAELLHGAESSKRVWTLKSGAKEPLAFVRPPRPWANIWAIDASSQALASVEHGGLPWLNRFPNRASIVSAFERGDDLGRFPLTADQAAAVRAASAVHG